MFKDAFISAVIVAAGNSTRMAGKQSKQFYEIAGRTVIARTLSVFFESVEIDEVIISARRQDFEGIRGEIRRCGETKKNIRMVEGGKTRQESVEKALLAVSEHADFVAIHDGARPLVTENVVRDTLAAALLHDAATTGVPVKDTIKQVAEDGEILATPNRTTLWNVQTPQVFRLTLYRQAMEYARAQGKNFTDDCQLLEFMGVPVYMVRGDYSNIKITTPEDIGCAEGLLKGRGHHAN